MVSQSKIFHNIELKCMLMSNVAEPVGFGFIMPEGERLEE